MPDRIPLQPTKELVWEYVARFDRDPNLQAADRALKAVFSRWPQNVEPSEVLMKVALVNALYSTNLLAIFPMAAQIRRLDIDRDLSAGNLDLVDQIARLELENGSRRHYSFATKYCSWHAPDRYPIYDSLVEGQLWQYRNSYRFAEFRRQALQDYPTFVDVVVAFQRHFALEELPFRAIDKFLWLSAHDDPA